MKGLLAILLVGILAFANPAVPNNYTTSVKTGGEVEAKYIKTGSYEVKYFEEKTTDNFKKYEVYYPKDLETTNTKYPVVVFVNGSGVKGSRYKALFRHLASWGFIVLGNEEESSWAGTSADKTLTYIINKNKDKNSIFYNKIDTNNIGASGHSQGGAGIFNAITKNKHSSMYKTAVALSPTHEELADGLKWTYDLTKVKIPILMIAGTKGDFETKSVIPLEAMIKMYNKLNVQKVMMRKIDIEHGQMLYEADGYVTAWFMWRLKNDSYAGFAFKGQNAEIFNNNLYQDVKSNILN